MEHLSKVKVVLIKIEKPSVITGQSRTLTVEICKYLVRSWLRILYGIIKMYTVSDIMQILKFSATTFAILNYFMAGTFELLNICIS